MPAKSRKQQKALYAKFGEKWVRQHHFDTLASPQTKKKKKTR